jgi:hypothetical protein
MRNNNDVFYYSISNVFQFAIHYKKNERDLMHFQKPLQTNKLNLSMELFLCPKRTQIPTNSNHKSHGYYKGIPWIITTNTAYGRTDGQIHLYAPVFRKFLALRMVLIPYIKREIAKMGGIQFIGSAFKYKGTTYILSGYPGCGKTSLMVQALECGAQFIGDDDLIVTPDLKIQGLLNLIQLRYDTFRLTQYWQRTRWFAKIQCIYFHYLSALTKRMITFALEYPPETLGIQKTTSSINHDTVFIWMSGNKHPQLIRSDVLINHFSDFEKSYQKQFANLFFTDQHFQKATSTMTDILKGCTLWRFPLLSKLEYIITQTRNT